MSAGGSTADGGTVLPAAIVRRARRASLRTGALHAALAVVFAAFGGACKCRPRAAGSTPGRAAGAGATMGSAGASAGAAAGASAGAAAPAETPEDPDAWRELDLPETLADVLATGRWDETPKPFRIVTLSLLADACAALAEDDPAPARACVVRAFALAKAGREGPLEPGEADEGLWWSHFALILGAGDATGPCLAPDLHAAAAGALAGRLLREPTRHVPSWDGVAYRWPADNTATLAALARHDRAHGTTVGEEPARAWRAYVTEHAMDAALGLPWSEATGAAPGARDPRGCALSFQTRYLSEFAPDLAALWWDRYKDAMLVDRVALVGLREWPPGHERPADADSGPIVEGVGAAATAFGIGAARSMGDDFLAARLEATGAVVGAAAKLDPALARAAFTALADAVLLAGATAHAP